MFNNQKSLIMMKYFERLKTQEVSATMTIWSIVLLIGFALFSVLIYMSKINVSNLMIYLIAFGAYIGFSLVFISSLRETNHPMQIKKRLDRHT
ncbi:MULTISPECIES: hypothetical protein [unclassified Chryseobacterium]|uniref:hypothetical protein n=1 Tax=unclassified Chryseobacterium TaxID=2593645 RepID=UPI00226A4310|nr:MULTISPECIES: hypothetical protein [unclassified Chryseobacterium]